MRLIYLILVVLVGQSFALAAAAEKKKDVLPAPTGTFSIGRSAFYWTDDSRPEIGTEIEGQSQGNRVVIMRYGS